MHLFFNFSRIEEISGVVENGLTKIYVNTAIHEDSDVSRLMRIFSQVDVYDDKFKNVSKRKKQYKKDEEGVRYMCSLVEEYAKEYRAEGKAEGQAIGEARAKVEMIENCCKTLKMTIKQACAALGVTEETYEAAKTTLGQ